jgi:hypothetical protein
VPQNSYSSGGARAGKASISAESTSGVWCPRGRSSPEPSCISGGARQVQTPSHVHSSPILVVLDCDEDRDEDRDRGEGMSGKVGGK